MMIVLNEEIVKLSINIKILSVLASGEQPFLGDLDLFWYSPKIWLIRKQLPKSWSCLYRG